MLDPHRMEWQNRILAIVTTLNRWGWGWRGFSSWEPYSPAANASPSRPSRRVTSIKPSGLRLLLVGAGMPTSLGWRLSGEDRSRA
jgi:hypothetical protein